MILCLEMAVTRFTKVEKREETEMIQCLDVALYQSPERRTKKKRFTALPCIRHQNLLNEDVGFKIYFKKDFCWRGALERFLFLF